MTNLIGKLVPMIASLAVFLFGVRCAEAGDIPGRDAGANWLNSTGRWSSSNPDYESRWIVDRNVGVVASNEAHQVYRVRYGMVVASDTDAGGGTHRETFDSGYSVRADIQAPSEYWILEIRTWRKGAITIHDDGLGQVGEAYLSGVTGTVITGNPISGTLDLAAVGPYSNAGAPNQDRDVPIDQSAIAIMSGFGDQHIDLQFHWTAWAESRHQGLSWGGDEAAVRLGLGVSSISMAAGEYPGAGNRGIAADGHFVELRLRHDGWDRNQNGVRDSLDISSGTSADCNGNHVPDEVDVRTISYPAGGLADDFATPVEYAHRGPEAETLYPGGYKMFDHMGSGNPFLQTMYFPWLPTAVHKAELEIRLRGLDTNAWDDDIFIQAGPTGWIWGHHIDGLVGHGWATGSTETLVLDLKRLPHASSSLGAINALGSILATQRIDVMVDESTTVDYMRLRIQLKGDCDGDGVPNDCDAPCPPEMVLVSAGDLTTSALQLGGPIEFIGSSLALIDPYDFALLGRPSAFVDLVLDPGTRDLFWVDGDLSALVRGRDLDLDGALSASEMNPFVDPASVIEPAARAVALTSAPSGKLWWSNQDGSQQGIYSSQDQNGDGDAMDTGETMAALRGSHLVANTVVSSYQLRSERIGAIAFDPSQGGGLLVEDEESGQTLVLRDLNVDGDFEDSGEVSLFAALSSSGALGAEANPDVLGGALVASDAIGGFAVDVSTSPHTYYLLSTESDPLAGQDQALVYRAQDRNGDGDVNDAGEVTLFWDGSVGSLGATAIYEATFGIALDSRGVLVTARTASLPVVRHHLILLEDRNGDGDADDEGELSLLHDTNADTVLGRPLAVPAGSLLREAHVVPSSAMRFGSNACLSSSGYPASISGGAPVLGETSLIVVEGPDRSLALILLGDSNEWFGGVLKLPFVVLPGCELLVDGDIVLAILLGGGGLGLPGSGTLALPVPLDPRLAGAQLHAQALVRDPMSPLGFISSNGVTLQVGTHSPLTGQ
ncbi:MAG: hypothetical protein H6833_11590 [Planctomycetes bacterium]|nr:hypothetical protein [Planctomycetota bacterium]